ncbi:MAG: ATP-binding protein [Firmicutes bacterium]|nr:ATP-binding protein [Bacillota bacterium]
MSKYKFELKFPSTLENAKGTSAKTLKFIKESLPDMNSDDLDDLKLILCELLYNAVIHGNNKDMEKFVYISVKIDKNEIVTVIEDEGKGFDYNKLLSKITIDDPIALFEENGRGIRLVMKLADNVKFEDKGSRIIFLKRVNCYG